MYSFALAIAFARAIKRGTGEIEGAKFERVIYEGYGPGGIAIMVEAMTDNKNRTSADIRNIFNRNNGSLGEVGCVGWLFERKGVILVDKTEVQDEEEFMLKIIDAGAEDIEEETEFYEIKVLPADLMSVKANLEKNNIKVKSSEIAYVPKSTIKLSREDAEKAMRLINLLDEHDDVQNVYSNLEITDEILSKIGA